MKTPEFKNTPNECVELKDGKKVFLSRALTVCVPVTAINKFNEKFYLVSIRGSKTPDFQHCFNIVCGYLDYDECLIEASKRELFEETGFFVDAVNKENVIYDLDQLPWDIKSTPNNKVQNVTHRYGFVFKVKETSDLPTLSTVFCEKGEVLESMWLKESELLLINDYNSDINPLENRVWAFNHYTLIREWIDKVKKLRID